MTEDEVEAMKDVNKFLLKEITKLANESVKREVMLAKLEAEVTALRGEG